MEEKRITKDFSTEVEWAISDALRNMGLEEGNTVYWIRDGRVHTGTIEEICLGNEDEECDLKVHDKEKTNDPAGLNLIRFYLSDFGMDLFFSKEQAEEVQQNPNIINQRVKSKKSK